jgi:hypothetical protein
MADIRAVVLSDLHFGAQNSLMTSVVERSGAAGGAAKFETDAGRPSPLLTAVLTALQHLIGEQDEPPSLVLAGDVLDLALSPDAHAIRAFEGFVDLAFGGSKRVFGPVVYYLPGNHDHHLWEAAREAQYLQYLQDRAPELPIEEPWHTTRMLPGEQAPPAANLMSTLIQRRPGCGDVEVRVVYPNLAFVDRGRRRIRVVSHGHYSESIYTLMTRLGGVLFPNPHGPTPRLSIERMERENFAWIDFFWGTLGRSGAIGTDLGLIYAELTSPADLAGLATNLMHGLMSKGHGPRWLRPAEMTLLTALAKREAQHLAASERGTPDLTLSAAGRTGVRAYLEGPVLRQITNELGGPGHDVGFVFGHTHKPFVEEWRLSGYPRPVKLSNTGGWVVDTAQPALTQGGVAVLIDDELNTASVQFYRQSRQGGTDPVRLLDPSGGDAAAGTAALHADLSARVDPQSAQWRAVAEAADRLISQRHRLQAALVAQKS